MMMKHGVYIPALAWALCWVPLSALPAVGAQGERQIVVLDQSASMGWNDSTVGGVRMKAAQDDILLHWRGGPDGQRLTLLRFDNAVSQVKDLTALRDVEPSDVLIGHKFYEALQLALGKAWAAAHENPPVRTEIVYYTDSDLDLPSDTMTRLAKDVGKATTPKEESDFFAEYDRLMGQGLIQLWFMVLDHKGAHPAQRGFVLGIRGRVLAPGDPRKADIVDRLDWYLVRAGLAAVRVYLGEADRPGLTADVPLVAGALRVRALPGFSAAGAALEVSGHVPGGGAVALLPKKVPCQTADHILSLTLPKGTVWQPRLYDLVVRASLTGMQNTNVSKREQELPACVEPVYLTSVMVGPTAYGNIAGVRAGQPVTPDAGWIWSICHDAGIGARAAEFPVSLQIVRDPNFVGGEVALTRNSKPLKEKEAWEPSEATDSLALKLLKGPDKPGQYVFRLRAQGRSFARGQVDGAPVRLTVLPGRDPNAPSLEVLAVGQPKVEAGQGAKESVFKAFSVTPKNEEARRSTIQVGGAKNLKGVGQVFLLAGDQKQDVTAKAAPLTAPDKVGQAAEYSLAIVPEQGWAGTKLSFTLPVAAGAGKELATLDFAWEPPAPPPPAAPDIKVKLIGQPKLGTGQPGQDVAFQAFSVTAGNPSARGALINVGAATNFEGVAKLLLEVDGQKKDLLKDAVPLALPDAVDQPKTYSVSVAPVTESRPEFLRFRLPVTNNTGGLVTVLEFQARFPQEAARIKLISAPAGLDLLVRGDRALVEAFTLSAENLAAAGKRISVGPAAEVDGVAEIAVVSDSEEADVATRACTLSVPAEAGKGRPVSLRFRVVDGAKDTVRLRLPVTVVGDANAVLLVDDQERKDRKHDLLFSRKVQPAPELEIVFTPPARSESLLPKIVPYGVKVAAAATIRAAATKPGAESVPLEFSVDAGGLPENAKVFVQTPDGEVPLPGTVKLPPGGAELRLAVLLPQPPAETKAPAKRTQPDAGVRIHPHGFSLQIKEPTGRYRLRGWDSLGKGDLASNLVPLRAARPRLVLREKSKDGPVVKANAKAWVPTHRQTDVFVSIDPPMSAFATELKDALSRTKLLVTWGLKAKPGSLDATAKDDQGAPAGGALSDWVDTARAMKLEATAQRKPLFRTVFAGELKLAGTDSDMVEPVTVRTETPVGTWEWWHMMLLAGAAALVIVLIWKLVSGHKASLEIEDSDGKRTVNIGRSTVLGTAGAVRLRAAGVATAHARICFGLWGGSAKLTQMASSDYTTIAQGTPVAQGQSTTVQENDVISLGDATVILRPVVAKSQGQSPDGQEPEVVLTEVEDEWAGEQDRRPEREQDRPI